MSDPDWADEDAVSFRVLGEINAADWGWQWLGEMEDAIIQTDMDGDPVFCVTSAAAYIRNNFIPRARVERLLGIIELADPRDMLPRATVRTVIKDLLK